MKIRILGNSVRLRLTKSEVNTFWEKGEVQDQIEFGTAPIKALNYSLVFAKKGEIGAIYEDHRISIQVPEKIAKEWVETALISMEREVAIGNGKRLKILVEKDFKCLTARPGEDESDNFSHP